MPYMQHKGYRKNVMKNYILYSFILIIFISCTKNLIKITPEYHNKFIDAEKLYIQFVPEQPEIEINNNLISSLGSGSKNETYLSYFEKNFQKFVKQNAIFQQVVISSEEYQFEKKELFINTTDKIVLKIPLLSKNEKKTDDSGYTLLLEDIKISHKKGESDRTIPIQGDIIFINGDDPIIIQLGKFVIWDNYLNKVVSYGIIDLRTKVKRNQVEETWADAFHALSKHLFSNSPFQKR
jgi:hypothetical protein